MAREVIQEIIEKHRKVGKGFSLEDADGWHSSWRQSDCSGKGVKGESFAERGKRLEAFGAKVILYHELW